MVSGEWSTVDRQATSSPAPPDESAQPPGDAGAVPAPPAPSRLKTRRASSAPPAEPEADESAKPSAQTTQPPTVQPPAWRAKLTKEDLEAARLELLRETDPDEYARVNDRFSGYVGKRLQVSQAERDEQAKKQQLLGLRQKAVQNDDPDAALEFTKATSQAELESQHEAAWSEAVGVFSALDANPATKPIVNGLAGRDYGQLAGGNGTLAALFYKADLAQGVIDHLPKWEAEIRADAEAKAEKKLRPAIEREVRARLAGEEPAPDAGSGAAPGASDLPHTLAETRRWIDRMPLVEYQRREHEIDRHLASFNGRRVATR